MEKTTCTYCSKPAVARGWCKGHYHRWSKYGDPTHVPVRKTVEQRFWQKVTKSETCWLWTSSTTRDGYGTFGVAGGKTRTRLAHRLAYELIKGKIPDGLTLDHLCRVRHCVNPDHLEPVTAQENTRRGLAGAYLKVRTHCPRGHAYGEGNTKISTKGSRSCIECQAQYRATYMECHGDRERERWRRDRAKRSAERKANPPTPATHCPKGHPYEGDNLYRRPDGRRGCKACRKAASDRHYAKVKAS